MWTILGCAAIAVAMTAAYFAGVRVIQRRWARELIEEHQRIFPDRCPVCSYHRYGLQEGHERPGSKPAPHDCPEAKAKPQGAYR